MADNLHSRNNAFRDMLKRLNRAQRSAVEQIEGPVLVIAGPGTGKTHILAARIGKILLETDAQPQNILCLTFTDAGAHAMRERLLTLIGPEAHRIPVYTFHGFCNRVIQENLDYFGRHDMEPVSDLERIEIIRDLLRTLPVDNPLRVEQKNPFTYERHLQDLFGNMKRENWTPGEVHRQVKYYLDGLPENEEFRYKRNGKGFRKNDLKTAEIAKEQERMARLTAAADLFPKFNREMKRLGRYDYEDMILWVIEAFTKNETLLRAYQERFLYLLVDEYQDTNGAQNDLLKQLIDYWDSPNVFIVGDDDQSIYEFQGARLKNLTDFYHQYKSDLLLVVLEENYRSNQPILDAAKVLIGKNQLRAIRSLDEPLEKNLRSVKTAGTSALADLPWPTDDEPSVLPQIWAYPNPLAEEADIIAHIEALQAAGEPLTEVAVLYAKHKQSERLMVLLDKKGIPFETKRALNILDMPLIRQFRALLEYLRDERRTPFSGEHRVFEMLHFRFWGISPTNVALTAAALAAAGNQQPWRIALGDEGFLKMAQTTDYQPFLRFFENIVQWLGDILEMSVPAFLEKTMNQSGLLQHLLAQPDRLLHLQAFNTLLDFAKKQAGRNPRYTLEDFLAHLDSLDANHIPLSLQQHIRTGAGVQLLTAHGSKGLEFRHVFLMGCTEDFWEKRRGNSGGRFALPPTLTLATTEDEIEAQRRLFYVACTRAKDHLYITYAQQNLEGKHNLASQFVAETGLPTQTKAVPSELLADAQVMLLLEPPKPTITLPEDARVDALLADFALSPTSFNRYLRCPLAFYYQDVLKVPDMTSENAAFGQAMHVALQQLFLQMKRNRGEFPTEKALVGYFVAEMDEKRALFGQENFKQYFALGENYLPRYYREHLPLWSKNVEVERRINLVEIDGVPITGVVDKFERLHTRQIRVVDYKTGQQHAEKTNPPNDKQPNGGDYWRQLVFYKILLEARMPEEGTVVSGAIAYLEPDSKKGAFPFKETYFTPEDVAFVKQLLKETDAQIRNRQFATGCGEPSCPWCRMHRENEVPLSLGNGEEDLDDVA